MLHIVLNIVFISCSSVCTGLGMLYVYYCVLSKPVYYLGAVVSMVLAPMQTVQDITKVQ